MRKPLLIVIAAVLAAGLGFASYRYFATTGNPMAGQALPPLAGLTDLEGHPHPLDEYPGKLVLINFWATWCGPCLQEIPELAKAQDKYRARGLQLVGPAVDDPEAVRGMVGPLKINYPVLVSTSSDDLIKGMEALQNAIGGLPFSVLVGTDGKIIAERLGPMTGEQLASLIEPHLPQ